VTLSTVVGDDEEGRRIVAALTARGVEVLTAPSRNGSERHVNLMTPDGGRLSIYLTLPDAAPSPPPPAALAAAVVVADLADHARPVLRAARAAGRPVWCDLHDWDGESEFHREFAGAADAVFASADRLPDPEAFLHTRIAAGARVAVCTRGASGALALAAGDDRIVAVPAVPVPAVVDTNGAGDAFFAGFLAAHLAGASLRECLERAAESGAYAVQSPGLG
jgi:sugar/nucleoside kinase (ribokinase family)